MLQTETVYALADHRAVKAGCHCDYIKTCSVQQFVQALLQSVVNIIFEVLIYGSIIARIALKPVVYHNELSVRHSCYELCCLSLRFLVEREMRTDHIVVVFIQ
jgi:hypothetical protein